MKIQITLCVLATTALAACGGGAGSGTDGGRVSTDGTATSATPASKEAYEKAVNEALEPVISASADLAAEAPSVQSLKDLALKLQPVAQTYSDAAEQLATITPPSEVGKLHERLVKASEELAKGAVDAQEAAEKDDQKKVNQFQETGTRYQEALTRIATEFAAVGYDFAAEAVAPATTTPTTPATPVPTTSAPAPTPPPATPAPQGPTTPPPPSLGPDVEDGDSPSKKSG